MPARVELTPSLPGLSPVASKPVVARFDGGRLSSDAGVLGLREIEKRLGIADRLAACLEDPRTPGRVVHGLAEIIPSRAAARLTCMEDRLFRPNSAMTLAASRVETPCTYISAMASITARQERRPRSRDCG